MLKKDDWTLVREQAKSQKIQALISLEISNTIIALADVRIAKFKGANADKKKTKAETQNF